MLKNSTEPAAIYGALAAIVVVLLSVLGVIVDLNTVEVAILAAVPIIQAILTRFNVVPLARARR